jgi:hypothetical protein
MPQIREQDRQPASSARLDDNNDYISENGILQKSILFRTPSGVSSFVLGASSNGNIECQTEDGKTLKAVELNEGSTQ